MSKKLTIVIPTYKSHKIIYKLLKTISRTYKIIIIENSFDSKFKNRIEKKYLNVKVYLKKNIGFGRAINFAAKKIKTKYFISVNPDAIFYKQTIINLLKAAEKINKFGAIGPSHVDYKENNNKDLFIERDKINGPVMFFKTEIFKKIKGFDENIFLYFEDNDYFKKCNLLNLKLYLIKNSFYNHSKSKKYNKSLDVKSSSFLNLNEKNNSFFIGGWHGQWSKFYYLKKYNGFFKAFIMCMPSMIINIFQLMIYVLINPTKAKYKYFKVEGFLCSLIGMSSFRRSKFDLDVIY